MKTIMRDFDGSLPVRGGQAITGGEFRADEGLVPNVAGAYMIFVRGGEALLSAAGYEHASHLRAPRIADRIHLYTGQSMGLCTRLTKHFRKDARVSTFRTSLLAIERACGGISQTGTPHCDVGSCEFRLNDWLRENVTVGYWLHPCPQRGEAQILARTASPLNIAYRPDIFSRRLRAFRAQWAGRNVPTFCRSALAGHAP